MRIHALALLVFFSTPALAKDWFVKAGSSGDGSMQSPFGDPWEALDKCQSGDVIHVAGGKYYGRLRVGTWEVPVDDLTLLGGYDQSFKTRDPWKNRTELLWDKTSKNTPNDERLRSNKKNTTLDGFIIDQRDQCKYEAGKQLSRLDSPSCESAVRLVTPGTVRNMVIINPGLDGIVAPVGSTLENNLIVNAVNWGININSTMDKSAVAQVKNNTIAFTFTFKEPGKGGYAGSALGLKGPTNVVGNIIANSDSNGVYSNTAPETLTLVDNLFFMNLYSNVKISVNGKDSPIDDAQMDLLEEAGFKDVKGNVVKNPELQVDKDWLDAVSKRTSASPGKLTMDDFNKARQLMGLPMIAKGGKPPSGVAPAMDLDDALKLMAPKSAGEAGARVKKLTVSFSAADAAPAKSYAKATVTELVKAPEKFEGKPVELIVGVSGTGNVSGIPAPFKPDDYAGVMLYETDGEGTRLTAFYKNGSTPDRTASAVRGLWNGSGKPWKLFLARGTAYAIKSYPKAGLQLDSLEPYDAPVVYSERPKGKDWFVRAGASGGDGSKEKPFKDPWQALEKVGAGDSIHVTEGAYGGKMKAGKWKINEKYVALIGGYDSEFKERNPWKHPTRLAAPADYKGDRNGYTVECAEESTGAIIDGFVFDRAGDNKYKPNGDIDYDNSTKDPHLWVSRPESIVRNCLFLNGVEGAICISNGNTMENNIFVNHFRKTVVVQRGINDTPFVFKNNTVAFSWELRFGEGNGRNGHLLSLENGIGAIVDGNIFEFADNDAIVLMSDPGDVVLTNNTFNHNLWSNLRRPQDNSSVDDKTFDQLRDYKFKKLSGNQVISAGLPVDQKFFDAYLGRTAYTPGKVTMDDWNQLREMIGQPVLATGGVGPEGLMPLYPWEKALQLFPKNPKVSAGARAKDLPVAYAQ